MLTIENPQDYIFCTKCMKISYCMYFIIIVTAISALVQIKTRKGHNWWMVFSRRIILISISVITVNPQLFKMKNIYLKNM